MPAMHKVSITHVTMRSSASIVSIVQLLLGSRAYILILSQMLFWVVVSQCHPAACCSYLAADLNSVGFRQISCHLVLPVSWRRHMHTTAEIQAL